MSQTCFGLKAARKGKRTNFEKSYFVCGAWGKFGTVSQFFIVRKSALEPKPHSTLTILSVGPGRAKKNFGTECLDHVFV